MPSRIIFIATTATSSSCPTVAGSVDITTSARAWIGFTPSAIAATRSRSVTIPISLPSDITATESESFMRI